MLHSLALVKIEDRGPIHFLEPLFEIAFINGNLPAEFFYGDWFPYVLNQDLSRPGNFIPVSLICQELATHHIDLFASQHAVQTIKKKHLGLSIDVDIFKVIGIIMIQNTLENYSCLAAEGQDLSKR